MIRVLRVLRIARVLKLLKMAKGIRSLLKTVMQALPQVGHLGLLFFLLFFIFSALGVEMFGGLSCNQQFPCQASRRQQSLRNILILKINVGPWGTRSLQNIWDGFPHTLQGRFHLSM